MQTSKMNNLFLEIREPTFADLARRMCFHGFAHDYIKRDKFFRVEGFDVYRVIQDERGFGLEKEDTHDFSE